MSELLGHLQSMCPSHKTENLESCGFLRSVYRYMCDSLAENLSFLSHPPLTQSPSLGKNALSSERLLAGHLTAVRSSKRHPGEVSSEAFQMSLKERNPLSIWVLLLTCDPPKSISNAAPYPVNTNEHFLQVHVMVLAVCVPVLGRQNVQNGAEDSYVTLVYTHPTHAYTHSIHTYTHSIHMYTHTSTQYTRTPTQYTRPLSSTSQDLQSSSSLSNEGPQPGFSQNRTLGLKSPQSPWRAFRW